jgi:hypothetical protein
LLKCLSDKGFSLSVQFSRFGTVTPVTAWDGEYTVRVDHLKPLNYSDSDCQQMQKICDRIRKLLNHGKLEASAQAVLKCLGELKRPYLTAFEEELLSFIEEKSSL